MKPKDILQLLMLAAIWGSSYLFLKIAAPTIGVSMTMGLRITIAALVMIVIFATLKRLPSYKTLWKKYLILGILNLVSPFALISFSIVNLNASLGAILNATTPFFTMAISSLWLKEKMTIRKITGLFIGLVGLTVIVGWIPLVLTGKVILSLLSSLLAAFSIGLGAVYTRIHMKQCDPLKTATGQLSAAALLVLPLIIHKAPGTSFTPEIIFVIVILAVICTAVGYGLYFKLISRIGSVNVSLVTLLVPVFSLIWAMVFLHEPLTPALAIGLLLILGSLKLIMSPSR